MNANINAPAYALPQAEAEQRSFMVKVYGWMGLALTVTALVAMTIASYDHMIQYLAANRLLFFGVIILQLILVGVLVVRVQKMSGFAATVVFFGYAALTGVTFSLLFHIYTQESIASTFLVTAGTFTVMSAYGYFTKRDLSSWGNLLFMGLVGIIIASLVNLFWQNEMFYWIVTYAGILVFVGLTAYDTQRIKEMNVIGNAGTDEDRKEAIVGALRLYLDFINLFLLLLRVLGNRR